MKHFLYLITFVLCLHTNAQHTLKSLGLKGKIKKVTISRFHALNNENTDSLEVGKGLFSTTLFFDKNGNYTKRSYKNIDQHLDMILGGERTTIPTYSNDTLIEENIFNLKNKLLEKRTFKYINKDAVTITSYKPDGILLQTAKQLYKNSRIQSINIMLYQNDSTIIKYKVQFTYNNKTHEIEQRFQIQNKDDLITKTMYIDFDDKGNWTKAYEENPYRWKKQLLFQEIEYY